VVLCGTLLSAVLTIAGSAEWASAKRSNARTNARTIVSGAALLPAVGNAPSFCQDQTWPHIDPRCVKRTEPAGASGVLTNQASVTALETKSRNPEQPTVSRGDAVTAPAAALTTGTGLVGQESANDAEDQPALSPSPENGLKPSRRSRHHRGSYAIRDRHAPN
jgi:hypothetical protein